MKRAAPGEGDHRLSVTLRPTAIPRRQARSPEPRERSTDSRRCGRGAGQRLQVNGRPRGDGNSGAMQTGGPARRSSVAGGSDPGDITSAGAALAANDLISSALSITPPAADDPTLTTTAERRSALHRPNPAGAVSEHTSRRDRPSARPPPFGNACTLSARTNRQIKINGCPVTSRPFHPGHRDDLLTSLPPLTSCCPAGVL